MKVLVTGAKGQLGYDVLKVLSGRGFYFVGIDRDEADITNEYEIKSFIKTENPTAVIHCAAYTAVDKAEHERELCQKINVLGTKYIAEVCKEIDAKMVYVSTDYVFDGQGIEPFRVTDKPNPISWYGQSKYEGEMEVQKVLSKFFIARTSWVFGENGNNFVKTMLRLGKERGLVSVVNDQIGSPTYTHDLAKLLVDMALSDKYGIYHTTNEGLCSWYEFAVEIFRQSKLDVTVTSVATNEYPTKARRPLNSRLDKKTTYEQFYSLSIWQKALTEYLLKVII